jgi:branched-chain amino acid transport system substrate-binding protein
MKRLIVSAAAALFAFAAPASAKDIYKIGLIADFTGAFASWGVQFQQAIEAFQSVNGKTLKGPKGEEIEVQVVYRDAASQGPEKTVQLAEELVLREKVRMLTGFDLSPQAMAVGKIADQAKIPVVIMNAATASIVRGSPYYVRVSMTIPQYVAPLPKWAYENGIKKVYTIVSDYAPGYDAETYFIKGFKAAGGEILGTARTPQQESNMGPYLEKAAQTKPDAIFMFQPAGAPSIAFVKAYLERGMQKQGIKLLGTGETQELFLGNFNDDAVGIITAMHYTETNTNPENTALRETLKKMFGEKTIPDIASVAAWDGMALIYQALAAVGAKEPGMKYVDAMKGKTLRSPRGTFMIDPVEREVVQNVYIRRLEKINGKLQNVDIASFPMVKDPWKDDNPVKAGAKK